MSEYRAFILSEEMAKEICTWKYPGEYSVYNFSDWDVVVENNWDLSIEDKRRSEFLGYFLQDELIAFGRIHQEDSKTILGIGLKPTFCNKGIGKEIMNLLILEAYSRFPNTILALEVRSFNIRAIKCYNKVGFSIKKQYNRETFNGSLANYTYMELE